jgi:internalin A
MPVALAGSHARSPGGTVARRNAGSGKIREGELLVHLRDVPQAFRSCIWDEGRQASLANQRLTTIPEWLTALASLTTLDLGGNQLSALPESIGELASLTTLDLGGNQLSALPESIGNLASLTTLNLGGNQLSALPESIGNLASLTTLDLGGNQLSALPESIGNLTCLTWLSLYGNQLTALPESIGHLTALTTLDLLATHLETLPESIGNLTALSMLSLRGNQLTALPESIDRLTSLMRLDLRGNRLVSVPRELADQLAKGLQLELAGNPLHDPLPEIIERGPEALITYLRSLEDAIAQYEAKLLMVGEGNVGKTSLVAALRGAPFVVGRPTTHGIEIWPLTFRHPGLDADMTLRAWDFGGQEVYRVTHQFFFSRRALYVIVWNARQGHEQDEVEDWLRRIRLRAGHDARTIVVATHCAERLPEIDYPHLKQAFQEMLVGNFTIDSRTGTGLPELRDAIGQQAAKLPQMGQLISPRWVAAREQILARSQVDPQIRYTEFEEVCKLNKVTGQEVVTLAQLMHDLGQIIYYGEDEGLRDIVVLNPEWLTKAISYVLEDQVTKAAAGVLDHARLREIWQERENGTSYPARYHPYFLRLMEKFDVSYRLEDDELRSIVAQLVPYERPTLPWEFGTQPPKGIRSLTFVCRLSEPAPGFIPWLTVRHHRASTGRHWRRGVFLKHPIPVYASEALLELRPPSELIVEVRAPSPDLFFNVLRDSVEDLVTRRWPGLSYQLLIPCPNNISEISPCPGLFPLDGLLRLREREMTTVPCMECADIHEISLLLTGFASPGQPLEAELSQMHDQLTRIESDIAKVEGQAAEAAWSVRRVLQVVSAEVTDCPRLFTLTPERPNMRRRIRLFQNHYRLTLWCEHPGYWHAWTPATYELDPPRDWFAKVSPYAALVFKVLQLVVPLVGSAAGVLLSPDELARAQGELGLMKTIVADLPVKPVQKLDVAGLGDTVTSQLTVGEGHALRAIRSILFQHDPSRMFGGMRRVQAPAGDLLWVCTEHYPEYDPGLPTVP